MEATFAPWNDTRASFHRILIFTRTQSFVVSPKDTTEGDTNELRLHCLFIAMGLQCIYVGATSQPLKLRQKPQGDPIRSASSSVTEELNLLTFRIRSLLRFDD